MVIVALPGNILENRSFVVYVFSTATAGNADNTEPEKRLTARIEAVSIFVILLITSPRFVYKTLLFYVKISSFIMQEIISFCNIPIRDSMCEKI